MAQNMPVILDENISSMMVADQKLIEILTYGDFSTDFRNLRKKLVRIVYLKS